MEPKRDMDERVNSDADPIDLIKAFLRMGPIRDDESGEDDGGVELAAD